jgi:hypothetical protein
MFELLKKNFKETIEIIIRYSEQFRDKIFFHPLRIFHSFTKKIQEQYRLIDIERNRDA